MADIVAAMTDRFGASLPQNQPPTEDPLNSIMQRRQEREQARQGQGAAVTGGEASTRLSRRERIIRQTTQPRAADRRSFATYIQRTPVRSNSFDVVPSTVEQETLNFRERFESSRQNIFGPRQAGSSENLTTSPLLPRRQTDLGLGTRPFGQTGSDSGSGSSTPRSARQETLDLAESLTEAFTRSLASADQGPVEVRNTSLTREPRIPSTNYQRLAVTNASGSDLPGLSSRRDRESRSRYRRRTIQGVDNSVREALEIEKHAKDDIIPRISRFENKTLVETKEDSVPSSSNSYSSYRSSSNRKLELNRENTLPVLGLDDDLVIYIDQSGSMHWIRENRQLLRAVKSKQTIPDIVVHKDETYSEERDGFICGLKGDVESRYKVLGEHIHKLKVRENKFEQEEKSNGISGNGDEVDGFLPLEMIDEKYKSVSLYTPPRPRQNLEKIAASKPIISLYDGINMEALTAKPTETKKVDNDRFSIQNRTVNTYIPSYVYARQAWAQEDQLGNTSLHETVVPPRNFSEPIMERQSSIHDNSDIHGEVSLVMDRLNGLGMTIDTSHLDYDEMRMIQRALEENPSPPETPSGFENFDETDGMSESTHQNNMFVSESTVPEPTAQTVVSQVSVENVMPQTSSETASSQSEVENETPNTSLETEKSKTSENRDLQVQPQSENLPIQSPSDISSTAKNNDSRMDTSPTTLPTGRLPSESSGSPKLQLPTIDWSTLRKKSSTDMDIDPETSASSGSGGVCASGGARDSVTESSSSKISADRDSVFDEEQISPTKKPKPDPLELVSEKLSKRNGEDSTRELSVEIPGSDGNGLESDSRQTIGAERKDSTGDSRALLTPVKSHNTSYSGSESVSPAGSETVTTVFEEFISVIPREVLLEMNRKDSF